MSFLRKLTDEQRKLVERLLREDRFTLNEMLDEIRAEFPADCIPSRSALGRAKKNFAEEAKELREIHAAADILVSEFGEDPDDKCGALLAQAVSAVVTKRALKELRNTGDDKENPQMDIDAVGALARAARAAQATKGMSLKNREEVRRMAREELIREQREKLEELGKTGEVDQDVLKKVIKAAYGL